MCTIEFIFKANAILVIIYFVDLGIWNFQNIFKQLRFAVKIRISVYVANLTFSALFTFAEQVTFRL